MAMAWVSNATASNTSGSAVTGTLGAVTAGQLVVLTISDDSAGAVSITGVTDNLGNTYQKVPITQGTTSVLLNASSTQMWYAVITNAGTLSAITVAWNTAATGRVTVAASYFNGFVGTPTIDKFIGATGTSTAPSSGATATTTDANEVVVTGYGHASTTSAFTAGSGYTNQATQNVANAAVGQASKIVSATAAMTGTATIAASRAWGIIVVTFKDVVGTTTTTTTASTTTTTTTTASTGKIKVHNGTSFVAKPVKVYIGGSWVIKKVKRHNGTSFVATNY